MYYCECGRKFDKKQGLNYHKNFCGKNKISLDGGYEYYIGNNGERVYIHIEIMEKKLGRKLKVGEIVHHKDENKRNNSPDNLENITISKHGKLHWELKTPEEKEKLLQSMRSVKGNKGKAVFGSKHKNSKLNEKQVLDIKIKLKDGATQSDLGKLYNVDSSTIREIKHERSWKHVKI